MKKKLFIRLAVLSLCFCILQLFLKQDRIDFVGRHIVESIDRNTYKSHLDYKNNTNEKMDVRENNIFVAVLCSGKQNADVGVNQRQFKHFTVLLKSAAMFTRSYLRFHIVTDTDKLEDSIRSLTSNWPEEYQNRLEFKYHKAAYPPGSEHMRNMFKPCASLRLFLPDMFPELDAAIYLDTDVIFLRRPEELWEQFYNFDDMQFAAIGPSGWYKIRNIKIPYYPPGGVNTGIIMMNITRMRRYPLDSPVEGGWSSAIVGIANSYKGRLMLGDMDIINIFFNQNPHLLYPLGCWWNFVKMHCKRESPCLPHMARENQGAAIVHGAGDKFIGNDEKKLKVLFQTFEKQKLGEPVSTLITSLKQNLSASKLSNKSDCDQVQNIDDILTVELNKYI